jgi:hypothetical protein
LTLESSNKIIKACTQEEFQRWDKASKVVVKVREATIPEISTADKDLLDRFSQLLICQE